MSERKRPNVVLRRRVRSYSTRHGSPIQLIVLHDTEGANIRGIRDLIGLANWFDSQARPPAERSSCHVGVDGEGQSSRMVYDRDKAWHCAYYNAPSLGIEQIGFASQTSWPEKQLRETARWIAWWSLRYDLPIQLGRVSTDGKVLNKGVVTHKSLGNLGGGHHDPGTHYPLSTVLRYARHYAQLIKGE